MCIHAARCYGPSVMQTCHLQARMTMARTIKLYKLAEETATPGIRPMQQADVPQVPFATDYSPSVKPCEVQSSPMATTSCHA